MSEYYLRILYEIQIASPTKDVVATFILSFRVYNHFFAVKAKQSSCDMDHVACTT